MPNDGANDSLFPPLNKVLKGSSFDREQGHMAQCVQCVQVGKKVSVVDELYIFDLMEMHVKNLSNLEFQDQKFFLYCILLIVKVKLLLGK